MPEYKIVEPNKDPTAVKIEKSGLSTTFTLAEMLNGKARVEKLRTELEGQRKLDQAKMDNIEQFHPFVLAMSPEDLSTVSLYFDSKGRVNACVGKIEECDKALEAGDDEFETIYEKFPELEPK